MNRATKLSLVCLAALGMASCKTFEGARVNVSPRPLEVHADTVKASIKASIPPKSGFKKDGTYTGTFTIKDTTGASTDKFNVGSIDISATQFPNIATEGAVSSTNLTFRYDTKMDGKQLVAENKYVRKSKTYALPDFSLAECCITTSRLFRDSKFAFGEDGARGLANSLQTFPYNYKQEVPVERSARFQFPKNVFAIQKGDYKKEDIVAIGEFIKAKYKATGVEIAGFASPEGPYARNQFLSINRSKEVQKWLIEELKKAGYESYLDSNFFTITTTSEDWEGFKANLDQTTYPEDTKRQIIEIVSAGLEEDQKEQQIMALVGGKNRVENILAPLRRATVKMTGSIQARSVEQVDEIANAYFAGTISADSVRKLYQQEEYLFAVDRVQDSKKKQQLLAEYVKAYPDDYRGYNNLGVLAMKNGKADEAFELFSQANRKKANDPSILNNMAKVQMVRGNPEDAVANARGSYNIQATPEAAFVLAYDHGQRARYTDAAKFFDEARDLPGAKFNSGLAKMLANDIPGAKASFDASIKQDPNDALSYYGLAILGARNGDNNLMVQNLRLATDKDAKMGEKAEKDLEFRSYWASAEFKAAVKR